MSAFFPPHFWGKLPLFFQKKRLFRQEEEEASEGEGSNEVTWWLEATIGPKKTPSPHRILRFLETPPQFLGENGQPKKVW